MKRRSFIQKTLVVSGGMMLPFKSNLLYAFSNTNVITGKVTGGGKPLVDVLVSDGYSIVTTNKNGIYKLSPDARGEFVFISIPSGYKFPEEDKLAKFYQPLGNNQGFDFKLEPLNKSDEKHSFIIWADPQVKNEKDVDQMLATSVPDVQQLVKEMGHDELIHGICVGDMVWDNHDLFPKYNKAVAQMGIPFFQALGNHDMDYRMGGDETSDQTFKRHYGPTYYSFNRGKVHYIVMDNVRYLGTDRNYDGYIVDQQLNWLAKDLEFVPKDQLIILCLHMPVHNEVKNNTDLYKLLAPFKEVHIMSGHTHYHRNVITDNIFEHNHGTVCGAWWTGPICEDGTPRGYGVYHVDGNKLKWYYKSTGQDKSSQISLFADELTNQKRIIANVWNWDPEWKVEYWADGQFKGLMENQKGFDPLAVKLYLGDKLPVTRSFAEPKKTNHLFIAHVGADVKKIKVVATDRFGDKYENEILI
jgi:predicted phosphodiesterase